MRQLVLGVLLVLFGAMLVSVVALAADADEDADSVATAQSDAYAESAVASARPSPAATVSPDATASSEPAAASPLPTEPPPFETDLPKRGTRDAPLFVGPTTTKVSGKLGSYRWPGVRYGADEVGGTVAVVPDGASCLARLKLIDDDETIADEWFWADSGTKETHQTTLPVGYAKAKLRVDSDCRSWSVRLKPLGDPELPYTVKEKTYTVKGDTIDELMNQTQHIKGKWAAYTEWYTTWFLSVEEGDEECFVTHGDTGLQATITYPKWKQPRDADPDVVTEWERFMASLRVHEEGHVTIALQGADAIDDRLDQGFSAPTCEMAAQMADDKATEILERYNDKSVKYDKDTDHGATQGTILR